MGYKMNGFQKGFLTVIITIVVVVFAGFQVLTYKAEKEAAKRIIIPNALADISEKIHYTPDPKRRYKFDVKTKTKDKAATMQIKHGLIEYIKAAKWCRTVNTGETYSVWIKDVWRGENSGYLVFRYRLQLRTKAMFRQGKQIHSEDLECVVSKKDEMLKAQSIIEEGSRTLNRVEANIVGLHAFLHIKTWVNDIEAGRIKAR
ncbi:MAG: hypothetical protein KAH48_06810 [Chlorobi bacterium]|nr:hypothetical protein [Chlorobiota bacterium]